MKASEEGTREWRRGVRHGDVWEKIAGDRRNNRCKSIEVRTNLVCLWNKMRPVWRVVGGEICRVTSGRALLAKVRSLISSHRGCIGKSSFEQAQ